MVFFVELCSKRDQNGLFFLHVPHRDMLFSLGVSDPVLDFVSDAIVSLHETSAQIARCADVRSPHIVFVPVLQVRHVRDWSSTNCVMRSWRRIAMVACVFTGVSVGGIMKDPASGPSALGGECWPHLTVVGEVS